MLLPQDMPAPPATSTTKKTSSKPPPNTAICPRIPAYNGHHRPTTREIGIARSRQDDPIRDRGSVHGSPTRPRAIHSFHQALFLMACVRRAILPRAIATHPIPAARIPAETLALAPDAPTRYVGGLICRMAGRVINIAGNLQAANTSGYTIRISAIRPRETEQSRSAHAGRHGRRRGQSGCSQRGKHDSSATDRQG